MNLTEVAHGAPEARSTLLAEGAVLVRDAPVADDEALLALCRTFGVPTREGNGPPPGALVRDLVWRPEDGAQPPLRLHTDSVFTAEPNALMALACLTPAAAGAGTSLLVHVDDVLDGLSEADAEVLASRPVLFVKERDGVVQQTWSGPVLGDGPRGRTIRFHREHAVASDDDELARALVRLVEVIDEVARPASRALAANDVLVLDNRRVLHARTAVSGSETRALRRVKMTDLPEEER